jgi:hypothetical protein
MCGLAAMAQRTVLGARAIRLAGCSRPVVADLGVISQAADSAPKLLGFSRAAEALNEAELNGLLLLQRRELASGLGEVGDRKTV